MASLMRATDWSATSLGPVERWPQALKVALRILLTSRFDMWVGWGPEVAFLYNDAYRPTLGLKHPASLGQPTRELWAEIWDDIEPLIRSVYERGEATWSEALLLLLDRNGYAEETYHTFSYSPVFDDDGTVGGLFCAVTEDTERVITGRRLDTLRVLASRLTAVESRGSVLAAAQESMAANPHDLPFTMTYLFEGDVAYRVGATGFGDAPPIAPADIDLRNSVTWPLGESDAIVELGGLSDLPRGAWAIPPVQATIVHLEGQGGEGARGAVIVGINPHRPLDADYSGYLHLMAGQVSAALASAEAYEAERHRMAALAEAAALREEAAAALAAVNTRLAGEIEARTAERDRLRVMFERAPGFMCVLRGPTHEFELVNEAYLQLIGHRDVVGLTVEAALPELVGQGFLDLLDQVFSTGETYVGHALPVQLQRTRNAALERRFVSLVYQPIVEDDGSISGIFAEGQDITEQVQSAEDLRELNATLEQRIETALLEREEIEDALRQSQKMEAVGQLTGGIAHDFNNLLTGIIGSLDLMQRKLAAGKTDDVNRYVAAATTSANRAAALTHRLLAFSRRQPLDPRPVNANRLVMAMEELLRRTIGESVELEIVTAGGLWRTLCDPNQLESALLNLAINARDAMPEGGKLTIETCNAHLDSQYAARQREVTPGQYVCICVSDTGTGMSAETIARVFEPFFTTKPIGQGTGLGLSMVYGFARQSDGYAKVYSEKGDGTTVKLYLPRHYGDGGDVEALADRIEPLVEGAGKIVLVVEDEGAVRQLVVEVLEELGFATIEAIDGLAGRRIVESDQRIDLMVTDVGLPGLNGRQLADAARALRPELKILFMTGYAENAAINGGFLDPGMELITKPFAVDTLSERISRMAQP